MTPNDIDNGRLMCMVGIALVAPAKFVIFRIQPVWAILQATSASAPCHGRTSLWLPPLDLRAESVSP